MSAPNCGSFAAATLLPLWAEGQHERLFEEIEDHRSEVERLAPVACLMKELALYGTAGESDETGAFVEAALSRISY
jgi:hypothetical protein